MKSLYFDYNYTEVCSDWHIPSIGIDNVLAPNRRQTIIWTNADQIHWRIYIYTALGGDELTSIASRSCRTCINNAVLDSAIHKNYGKCWCHAVQSLKVVCYMYQFDVPYCDVREEGHYWLRYCLITFLRQAIIRTHVGSILIGPLGTNFNDISCISIFIQCYEYGNVVRKYHPFGIGLNELNTADYIRQ